MQLLSLSQHQVVCLFRTVAASITPAPISALALLHRSGLGASGEDQLLQVGSRIDDLYSDFLSAEGGLCLLGKSQWPEIIFFPGQVSEVVGKAGMGKTQCCLSLVALVVLLYQSPSPVALSSSVSSSPGAAIVPSLAGQQHNDSGSIIFIDTEATFSATRLAQLARARFPSAFATPEAIAALMEKVLVFSESTCADLLKRLQSLQSFMIDRNVKLIIVDSVASIVRIAFDNQQTIQRQQFLGQLANELKVLSTSFHVPVVVTNQITTTFASSSSSSSSSSTVAESLDSSLQAALGISWFHAVNTRFSLEEFNVPSNSYLPPSTQKKMILAKSPVFRLVEVPYTITPAGFVPVG